MKKEFEKAEIKVIRFEENDVIATSGGPGGYTETPIQNGEDEGE